MFISTFFVQAVLTTTVLAIPAAREQLEKRATSSGEALIAPLLTNVKIPKVSNADAPPHVTTPDAAGVGLVGEDVSNSIVLTYIDVILNHKKGYV